MQQFLGCRLMRFVVSLPGLDIISQDHEFLTAGNCLVPLIDGLVLTKVIIYYMMIFARANDCTLNGLQLRHIHICWIGVSRRGSFKDIVQLRHSLSMYTENHTGRAVR